MIFYSLLKNGWEKVYFKLSYKYDSNNFLYELLTLVYKISFKKNVFLETRWVNIVQNNNFSFFIIIEYMSE